ncbi:MAG: LysE family translocator [Pseudomonadota bacterium]
MDWLNTLSFVAIASLLVVSPGPNGVLIAKTVPTSGKAAGFANVAGFLTAFYLHGALAILGISAILLASSKAFFLVKMIGAAYLCWIGVKALRDAYRGEVASKSIEPANRQQTLALAYTEGLLTNALNPKVSMFYLAAFPQFIPAGEHAIPSAFFLVFLHSVINAVWFGSMVLLFARLSRVARSGSFQRWLKGVTGAVFVGFGLKLATYRP